MFCEAIDGVKSSRPSRIASGSTDCRQTIWRSAIVSASIWSSGEYLVPAASDPYERHSTSWAWAAGATARRTAAIVGSVSERVSVFRVSGLEDRVFIVVSSDNQCRKFAFDATRQAGVVDVCSGQGQ